MHSSATNTSLRTRLPRIQVKHKQRAHANATVAHQHSISTKKAQTAVRTRLSRARAADTRRGSRARSLSVRQYLRGTLSSGGGGRSSPPPSSPLRALSSASAMAASAAGRPSRSADAAYQRQYVHLFVRVKQVKCVGRRGALTPPSSVSMCTFFAVVKQVKCVPNAAEHAAPHRCSHSASIRMAATRSRLLSGWVKALVKHQ